jgi:Lon protease-like protein
MRWPSEIGVMVLPNVILFPQSYLPLYIFEPRYRRMLTDSLGTHRLFCVAMKRRDRGRDSPASVAGLGLVRAAREHADGTSHLILQGIARVERGPAVRYRPYRTHQLRVLRSQVTSEAAAGALAARLLELVARELENAGGVSPVFAGISALKPDTGTLAEAAAAFEDASGLNSPEQIADLISWTVLASPGQRQRLLETLEVETRLRWLIRFLQQDRRSGAQP